DYYALLGFEQQRPLPKLKVLGVCLVLGGRLMQNWTADRVVGENSEHILVEAAFVGFICGWLQPIQTGLNNLLNTFRFQAPLVTSFWASLISTICLGGASLVSLAFIPFNDVEPTNDRWT